MDEKLDATGEIDLVICIGESIFPIRVISQGVETNGSTTVYYELKRQEDRTYFYNLRVMAGVQDRE